MSKDRVNAPFARSWREIPQPVKPRAMSRGGQWRLALAGLRMTAVLALCGTIGWGAWMIASSRQVRPRAKDAAVAAVPLQAPRLKSDGVLDGNHPWIAQVLALRAKASLIELDLGALRERVLAEGQVATATLTRQFPDILLVQITERTPIARIMAEVGGERRQLLVARDGVIFEGEGYDSALLQTLPWLDGVRVAREAGRFLPIAGMEPASALVGRARLEAEHLYRTWHVISLERLASDREIEVRTRTPVAATIVFSANGDFLLQLAKLDYLWDQLVARPMQHARIDLSLGRQVPVTVEPMASAMETADATRARPGGAAFNLFSPLSSKIQREL